MIVSSCNERRKSSFSSMNLSLALKLATAALICFFAAALCSAQDIRGYHLGRLSRISMTRRVK